ncbi:MAG: hypothetical protein M1819_002578 [Sarea resinae]|nr:MAG: hypothetical protein M1819_002578 [Sarea resinae]
MGSTKRKHGEVAADSEEKGDSGYTSTTPPAPISAECPFSVEYARLSRTLRKKGSNVELDEKGHTVVPRVERTASARTLDTAYIVRPNSLWEATKKYRNFVVGEETFGIDDFVYINHSNIAHGASIAKTDEHQFWIARVLEVKARDQQHVYLRVFWAYWPEELPGGRKEYHGSDELVLSNHMEIVDAMTVTGKAPVSHLIENDEENVIEGLYWRQTYNVLSQKLSSVRRHCICKGYYNPDKMLIGCPNPDCKKWLHKECILADARKRSYDRLVKSEAGETVSTAESEGAGENVSVGDTINVGDTVKAEEEKKAVEEDDDDDDEGPRIRGKRVSPAKQNSKLDQAIWDTQFSADLTTANKDDTPSKLLITDLRGEEPKSWEEDIKCLACQVTIKSGYPLEINFPMLERLHLRTLIYLADQEPLEETVQWAQQKGIQIVHYRVSNVREPFVENDPVAIKEALKLLADSRNFPILLHSNKGKHRVGVLAGCMRKLLQSWSLAAINAEYMRFAGEKGEADLEFIELFEPELEIEEEWKPSWLRR